MDRASKRMAATIGIVAGLGLAIACPLVWLQKTSLATAGELPIDDGQATRVAVTAPVFDTAGVVGDSAIYVRPAVPLPITDHPRPTRVAVDAVGLSALVLPVSMASDGTIDVISPPTDIRAIGWLDSSATADAQYGSTVLVGHRDSWAQGEGALFSINDIPGSSVVRLVLSDGTVQRYRAIDRRRYKSNELPADLLLSLRGPHRLVLITCGGDLNPVTGHYDDNVVVTAVPIAAPTSR